MQNQKNINIKIGDIIKDTTFNTYYYVVNLTETKMQFVDEVGNSLHFNGMDKSILTDFIILSTMFRSVA